ncbi:hypothetical protein [Olivibacter domesticus]|nr:hypothetical protein [Olivibacter domesticus]
MEENIGFPKPDKRILDAFISMTIEITKSYKSQYKAIEVNLKIQEIISQT